MKTLLSTLTIFAAASSVSAQVAITVTGGRTETTNVVCKIALPPAMHLLRPHVDVTPGVDLKFPDGGRIPAQIVGPGVLDPQDKTRYLVFVLPKVKADATYTLSSALAESPATAEFHFVDEKGKHFDLLFDKRRVLRYIYAPHDPDNHLLTMKPFHQVFDPVDGKTLLTTGASKDGLYPHHRGLFFGFNKISYGDKKTADIWHGTNNVFSQHDKTIGLDAGRVLGRQREAISWHGKDGAAFATEEREVTVYDVTGGTMIDWCIILSTANGVVKLDGDPQHSGFHFRAAQEVAAKVAAEQAVAKKENRPAKVDTYFLRPDGKGKPGETRNWDPKDAANQKEDKRTIDLPWNAMSFVLEGKHYTVLRINHPDNPKETRGSERDYGRIGDYFEYTLAADKPLRLRYRVWVQEGEMTVQECQALTAAFVNPPAVKIGASK